MSNTEKQTKSKILIKLAAIKYRAITLLIGLFLYSSAQADSIVFTDLPDFKVNNTSILEVVKRVEQETNYKFVYSNADVDVAKKISIDVSNKNIKTIAESLFPGYTIVVKGNNVIVTPSKPVENVKQTAVGRKITGTVRDAENNEPLIGVSIQLKGTHTGVITDVDGNYSIEIPNSKSILIFSYIGFETSEIRVGNLGVIDVELKPDSETLDEVVVIGAGTQKKVSVTGSIKIGRASCRERV